MRHLMRAEPALPAKHCRSSKTNGLLPGTAFDEGPQRVRRCRPGRVRPRALDAVAQQIPDLRTRKYANSLSDLMKPTSGFPPGPVRTTGSLAESGQFPCREGSVDNRAVNGFTGLLANGPARRMREPEHLLSAKPSGMDLQSVSPAEDRAEFVAADTRFSHPSQTIRKP